MVRLSPFTFRVVGETARREEVALTSAREDRDHVGHYLREAREALGRDVDEIALALRIRPAYLESIEDGRFGDLPGPTYAVGFIRTYADFLGLDAAAIVARFKSEALAYSSTQPELDFIATPEGRFPGGALVFVAVLLAVGGIVGWSYLDSQETSIVQRIAEPPALANAPRTNDTAFDRGVAAANVDPAATPAPARDQLADAAPATDTSDTSVTSYDAPVTPEINEETSVATEPEPPVAFAALPPAAPASPIQDELGQIIDTMEPSDAVEQSDVVLEPPPVSPGAAVAAEQVAPPQVVSLPAIPAVNAEREGGRTYGQVNTNARIVLTATADSWVQVRDDRQNVLLTRMLQPGDSYRVPDRSGLTLLTGNAGGLSIKVDGAEIGQLGPTGAVRRDISLDPDALKTLAN